MTIFFQFMFNIEHLHETSRYYTKVIWRSCYSVGFPWASLSISKYTHIIPVDCTLNEHFRIFKYLFLISFWSETGIKHEFFLHILVCRLAMLWSNLLIYALTLFVHWLILLDSNFQSKLVDYWNGVNAAHTNLIWIHGSYSAIYTNFPFHILDDIMESFSLNSFRLIFEPQPLNLVDLILILVFQIGHFSAALFLYLFKLLLEALGHRFKRLYLTLELGLFISVLWDYLFKFFYLVFENIHFALGILNIFVIFLFLV